MLKWNQRAKFRGPFSWQGSIRHWRIDSKCGKRERGGAASEGVARTHDLFTFADVRCLAQADRDKLPVTCPH